MFKVLRNQAALDVVFREDGQCVGFIVRQAQGNRPRNPYRADHSLRVVQFQFSKQLTDMLATARAVRGEFVARGRWWERCVRKLRVPGRATDTTETVIDGQR